ncbi:MAG: 3'-5' exonuclease [Bacteroidia bacterium]|nr:3'-5' exonuclease [Bacteroidia bacterium]
MPWMISEDQLDPDQKEFINNELRKQGNIWIQGFPGSGKSVLLVYCLKSIVQDQPRARVAVVVYTHSLIDMFKVGIQELNLPSTNIEIMTFYEFMGIVKNKKIDNSKRYDYIFCDEVQDLVPSVLRAMVTRAKRVFVAGDSNQSIYDKDPKWQETVVDCSEICTILNARPFKLNMIHRLTRSIISAIQKLSPSMNIWSSKRDLTKQDVNIRLCNAKTLEEEVKYVYQEAQKGARVGDTSAILLPTRSCIRKFVSLLLNAFQKPSWQETKNTYGKTNFDDLNQYLKTNGIKLQFVGSGYGSLHQAEQNKEIILMTYHSSKGLDFDNVFLPFLNTNLSLPIDSEKAESLFMVAMTRSRKNLYLTYTGNVHEYVNRFKDDCTKISIDPPTKPSSTISFDF